MLALRGNNNKFQRENERGRPQKQHGRVARFNLQKNLTIQPVFLTPPGGIRERPPDELVGRSPLNDNALTVRARRLYPTPLRTYHRFGNGGATVTLNLGEPPPRPGNVLDPLQRNSATDQSWRDNRPFLKIKNC